MTTGQIAARLEGAAPDAGHRAELGRQVPASAHAHDGAQADIGQPARACRSDARRRLSDTLGIDQHPGHLLSGALYLQADRGKPTELVPAPATLFLARAAAAGHPAAAAPPAPPIRRVLRREC